MFEGVALYVLVFVVVILSLYMAVSWSVRGVASDMHDQLEAMLVRNLDLHKGFLEKIKMIVEVDRPKEIESLTQAQEMLTQATEVDNTDLMVAASARIEFLKERVRFWDSLLGRYENLVLSNLETITKVKKTLGHL